MIPADQLAELLWAPDPPPTAPVALRNYVMRLRRAGPAGQHLIQTRPGGYLITPGDCELDLARMEQELAAARQTASDGHWHRAVVHADEALGWWRGEPLSDVDLPALTAQHVPRLTETRLQARELRIEANLRLARHAEALDAYRAARDVLAREIGADPGPELQALQQQVLRDDSALAAPPAPGGPAGPPGQRACGALAGEVPRQLPATVACFTGRGAELTGLPGAGPGGAVPALVISAIGGTAGVGKTALAVQWAHQVAGRFPDGELYVNLRDYDPRRAGLGRRCARQFPGRPGRAWAADSGRRG